MIRSIKRSRSVDSVQPVERLEDWNGKPIAVERSGGGTLLVCDPFEALVRPKSGPWPPSALVMMIGEGESGRYPFPDELRTNVSGRFGHHCALSSINSEDAITWSWFGTLMFAPESQRAAFLNWLGDRIGLPWAGTVGARSICGEESRILTSQGVMDRSWTSFLMATSALPSLKRNGCLPRGQVAARTGGSGKCTFGSASSSSGATRCNGERGKLVLGVVLARQLAADHGPDADQVVVRSVTWQDLTEYEEHPNGDEFGRSYRWKLAHSPAGAKAIAARGNGAESRTVSERLAAIGVDGCRAGWIAARGYEDEQGTLVRTELRLLRADEGGLGVLVDQCEAIEPRPTIALDVPIGLPRRAGWRSCDQEARDRLGQRRACVFPVIDRELLGPTFQEAREVVLKRRQAEAGNHPIMTKQAIAIGPKIAEVDKLLASRRDRQDWLTEVHPELSFLAIAKSLHSPLAAGLPLKTRAAGYKARLQLIEGVMPGGKHELAAVAWLRRDVGRDDPPDAYAALWSAHRHHHRVCDTLGGGESDERGLLQRMIV